MNDTIEDQTVCCKEGCEKPVRARGMCATCYNKWWRFENPNKYTAQQDRSVAIRIDRYRTDPEYREHMQEYARILMRKRREAKRRHPSRLWTEDEMKFLKKEYSTANMELLCEVLGRKQSAIYNKASVMRLSRSSTQLIPRLMRVGDQEKPEGYVNRRCKCTRYMVIPPDVKRSYCSCGRVYVVKRYYDNTKIKIEELAR
jgi:hypothetical protein